MHVDHLKRDKGGNQWNDTVSEDEKNMRYQWLLESLPTHEEKNEEKTEGEVPVNVEIMDKSEISSGPELSFTNHPSTPKIPKTPIVRKSKRIIKAPERLDL